MVAKLIKNKLIKRIASAAILAPLTILIIWLGGGIFLALVALGAAISMYEWTQIARKTDFSLPISFAGLIYISLAGFAFYMIRDSGSFAITVTFMFCVWASDTLAYFVGKAVGGKKLAPSISPNKTWAGLFGAVLGPVLILISASFLFSWQDHSAFTHVQHHWFVMCLVLGAILGFAGQAGDLIISYLKRLAQVKDSGNLIPGHGGLLDRIDSLLLSAIIFGLAYGAPFFYG